MSASDSDCSIDWLASDDEEDCNSVSERDCGSEAGVGETPSLPVPSRAESYVTQPCRQPAESDCNTDTKGGKVEGSRQATKRPYSPTEAQGQWSWPHPEKTANDQLFACKCMELQCYVPHLSSILSGLQSGRYRERLSSFQESVAMDRIQRIMGVLRNPCMGERYINIILKVEEMLRSWFPNVKPKDHLAGNQTVETTPSKRLKLCPATTAESPVSLHGHATGNKALGVSEPTPLGVYSATNLKWLHTSPICSPSVEMAAGRLRRWPVALPGCKDVTQDNAVSSSTDSQLPPNGQRPPLGKINAPAWRDCSSPLRASSAAKVLAL
ncbi:hypothetical protein AGOR_G00005780 [Albula goreensis]|uniref:Circadian-associated transcriptional repressor-like n=1 Tax=Albula goreensis TaxID=1534307 RepID=A0A8T3E4W7_9TELE|nr:hypothetical protein AGOR_G00005780 [Albula goreensis]